MGLFLFFVIISFPETVACLASRDAESEKTESSALQSTSLRRRAAAYLASDERYRGKKTSRKDLYEFAGDSSNDDDMDSVDQESVGDETSNKLVNGYSDSEEDEDEEVEEKEVTDEEEDEEETDAEGEKDAVHDEDDDDKASPLTTDNSDIDEEEEGEEEDREMLDDSANYEDDLDDSQELADDYDDASDEEITSKLICAVCCGFGANYIIQGTAASSVWWIHTKSLQIFLESFNYNLYKDIIHQISSPDPSKHTKKKKKKREEVRVLRAEESKSSMNITCNISTNT